MRPSYAHLVTHIAGLREPAEQMAMTKAVHLIRAFSGGSEHLSLWYSAYTEPISRAFIPAVTQKTSADPSWDNTEQRGFIFFNCNNKRGFTAAYRQKSIT